jgi:hypothetical protein
MLKPGAARAQSASTPASEVETQPPDAGAPEVPQTERADVFVLDRKTRSPQQVLAPRPDNQRLAPPPLAGYIGIPGTQMELRLGGAVSTVFLLTNKLMGSQTWFVTSTIPASGQPYYNSAVQFTGATNQSDINFEFRTPTPAGELRIVYNNDFSNPSSNAFTYKLNYFYAQVANLLVGFSNSVFTDVDSYPNTLDYEGPNALVFNRQAMVSYTASLLKDHGKHLFMQFSIQVPSSQIPSSAGTPRSVAPDGAISIRMEGKPGHLQLATVLRGIGTQTSDNSDNQTVFGWGLNLTGGLNIAGGDYFSAGVSYGQGAAAYFNDTGGSGLDAALNSNGQLVALPIFGVFGGYTHHWVPKWSSTATYGYLSMDDTSYLASLGPNGFQRSQYASLNLIFQPYRWLMVGTEGLWGYNRTITGASGQAWREQFNAQFTF